MIQAMPHFQALQLEHSNDGQEYMVVLRGPSLGGGFRQGRIGFERLVEHFDLPPFLVDHRHLLAIAR